MFNASAMYPNSVFFYHFYVFMNFFLFVMKFSVLSIFIEHISYRLFGFFLFRIGQQSATIIFLSYYYSVACILFLISFVSIFILLLFVFYIYYKHREVIKLIVIISNQPKIECNILNFIVLTEQCGFSSECLQLNHCEQKR